MSEKEKSLTDMLEIDKYSLDVEWVFQPTYFHQWAEKYAIALKERDKAKQYLELVRAQLYRKVVKDPGSYGLDKLTEAAIQNRIIAHEDHTKAHEKYITAVYNAEVCYGAKEALTHRRAALENLTKLLLSDYWSEPKSVDSRRLAEKGADEKQRQSLRKVLKRD